MLNRVSRSGKILKLGNFDVCLVSFVNMLSVLQMLALTSPRLTYALQLSSPRIVLQSCPPADISKAAQLTVNAFYEEQKSFVTSVHFDTLTKLQSREMEQRYMLREQFQSLCDMFTMVDDRNNMIGVCELFLQELDYQLLLEVDPSIAGELSPNNLGKVSVPKIANLAVERSYRGQGLGKRLVEACLNQSLTWGFQHISLFVDDDNKTARKMYHDLGFRDMYLDRTEKKYVIQGLWLKLVPASKYLMMRRLNEYDSIP